MEDDYVDEDYEHTAAKLNETNPHNTAEETAGESDAQGGVGPKYSSSSPTTSTYHLSLLYSSRLLPSPRRQASSQKGLSSLPR